MNTQEVAKVLTVIASVDDRFDPDSARLTVWDNILDSDMTYSFAVETVTKHYANGTKTIMPADLNIPWRNFRDVEIRKREISLAQETKREISPETKRLIQELKTKFIATAHRSETAENAENSDSAE